MKSSNLSPFFFPLLLLLLLISSSESVNFNCTGTSTCQSLAGYVTTNATTYGAILSLFQVPSLPQLLGANNLPLSTPASAPVAAASVVRVPLPCACGGGKGRSNHTPIYTVRPADQGLDDIARLTYDLLVSYEEIAAANGIAAPFKISTGERLWIPLPCSCDAVDGEEVVHLAHLVEAGSTISLIAEQFGTTAETLMRINGIGDPRTLEAGQAIDVPLKACSSSISSTSLDSNLRLPNDSYALTAHDCIQCSCSSASGYQLACHSTQGNNKSCTPAKCDNQLALGSTSSSGCEQTTCAYAGYANATNAQDAAILTKTIYQSFCQSGPAAAPGGGSQPGSSHASRWTVSQGNWICVFVTIIVAFACSRHRA